MTQFARAIAWIDDFAFLQGNGLGKPQAKFRRNANIRGRMLQTRRHAQLDSSKAEAIISRPRRTRCYFALSTESSRLPNTLSMPAFRVVGRR
jgi:hypothetical protein